MAKAYWVVCYRAIKNQEAWGAYAKLAVPAIQQSAAASSCAECPPRPTKAESTSAWC